MKIILPKTFTETDAKYGPVFFLAGPRKGGNDWQHKAVKEIQKHLKNFYAVLPNNYDDYHPLIPFKINGVNDVFERQLQWERHYLDIASRNGCIIFWLPVEDKANPRSDDKPYAMDTRGELGEWRGRMMNNDKLRIVIGAENDFPGLSQIQRNFNEALHCEFSIYKTLTDTIKAAIKISQD
jgi:hypothetical protein